MVRKIHEAQFSTQLLDPIVEALLEFVDPAVFVHPDAVLFDPFGGIGHKLAQILARFVWMVQRAREAGRAVRETSDSEATSGLVWKVADVFMRESERAAACSHRPENVSRIFLDANSRHWMARAVLAMPEMQAIREALLYAAEARSSSGWLYSTSTIDDVRRRGCARLGLPESVVAWVLQDGIS